MTWSDQRATIGEIIVGIFVVAMIVWTAYTLGLAALFIHQMASDPSGEVAWNATKAITGGDESAHTQFTVDWLDPQRRAAWLNTFEASFWTARIDLWYKPMVVLALLAVLFRPHAKSGDVL